MIRLQSIGVRNLRSLKALDSITFKPLNILVGRNSAGKSSFARLLPLLKQSSEKRKQSPILWWGRLVDFGTFDDVYSSLSQDGFVDISIGFNSSDLLFLYRTPYWREPDIPLTNLGKIDATFRLGKNLEDGTTILRELRLDVFGVNLVLTFTPGSVTNISINGRPFDIPSNIRLAWTQGALLPLPRSVNTTTGQTTSVSDESLFGPRRFSRLGASGVKNAVSWFLHGNTQEDRKEEIAERLPIGPIEDLLAYCKNFPNSTVTWKSTFSNTTSQSNAVKNLHSSLVLYKLDLLIQALDDVAQRHLLEVSYLEPLRATAQRFYRREEISTDELDPKGLNTPFFIQGLTARERDSLNAWTKENFGFTLSITSSGGHVSLNIQPEEGNAPSRNLADVGLGYSQLVPVALQLWSARYRRNPEVVRRSTNARRIGSVTRMVVVEQPELHLHPAYQARIADVFAASIHSEHGQNKSMIDISIIAETHSSNLISRLGELISEGKLPAELVQILLFEKSNDENSGSTVRVATFDEDGILRNWPIGFFDA